MNNLNKRIGVIDITNGVATFNYGRNPDFNDMDDKDSMLEQQGYKILSSDINFNQKDGVTYIINFEPRDLVA